MIRSATTVFTLTVCALAGGGCVFSIGGGTTREIVYTQGPPPGPPGCTVDPKEYSVTIDEINAASTLQFDPSRRDALVAIAQRRGLADSSQEYLVCMTMERLEFEPSKRDVIQKLINNPEFSPRGKAAVLRNLNRFAFDPTRADLLREMQGKGDIEPAGRIRAAQAQAATRPVDAR